VKVLIDGKEVPVLNDVTVIYDDVPIDIGGREIQASPHVTLNCEGIVTDMVDYDGDVTLSAWYNMDDIVERCH